jgi:hypothetical protein
MVQRALMALAAQLVAAAKERKLRIKNTTAAMVKELLASSP